MTGAVLDYGQFMEDALRGMLRRILAQVEKTGLWGGQHLLISFRTRDEGVRLSPSLLRQYPHEMSIALQHQFWDLKTGDASFSVTLSFNRKRQRLTVPFASVTALADPSSSFGLQLTPPAMKHSMDAAGTAPSTPPAPAPAGQVVPFQKLTRD
ncbi:MAG: ClpXP protease specificity-enhancing factor SspB [Acidobacteriota bacterium]